jgi:hypothetical protein
MVGELFGMAIIVIVYICLFIILFSPTLYAVWFYFVSKRVSIKSKRLMTTALMTFCINSIGVYFLVHLAFDYFLVSKVEEKDALAVVAVRSAMASQDRCYLRAGRYYAVGPVRGPYEDNEGLSVDKDVVIEVVPTIDRETGKSAYEVFGAHVWGKSLIVNSRDGTVKRVPPDSEIFREVRPRLLRAGR